MEPGELPENSDFTHSDFILFAPMSLYSYSSQTDHKLRAIQTPYESERTRDDCAPTTTQKTGEVTVRLRSRERLTSTAEGCGPPAHGFDHKVLPYLHGIAWTHMYVPVLSPLSSLLALP